jgi:hypothetical protein
MGQWQIHAIIACHIIYTATQMYKMYMYGQLTIRCKCHIKSAVKINIW